VWGVWPLEKLNILIILWAAWPPARRVRLLVARQAGLNGLLKFLVNVLVNG